MNYEEMSDYEINKAVLIAMGLPIIGNINELFVEISPEQWKVIDYCNNPADMWTIMQNNAIGTVAENGKLIGATTSSQQYYEPYGDIVYSYNHHNPLRAAAIVFLMMKDAEKANG